MTLRPVSRRAFLDSTLRTGAAVLGTYVLPKGMARPATDAPNRPNIVFILADDLGWSDLVCYGNRFYETPNIDRMAREGMRFTDAYAAAPVCSPTRASILSGRYPAAIGLTEWIPGKRSTPRERLLAPEYLHKLPAEQVTVAEVLGAAGYVCGHVGKWHLGGTGNLPEDQGFHVNVGGTQAGSPAGGYFLPNRMDLPGARKGEYLTDRLSEEGVAFIRKHAERPFFLYQSYHSVHTPIQAKKVYVDKYRKRFEKAEGRLNPTYAGMVRSLDDGVGSILDALDDLGLSERTVVFFMSDNGGLSGVTDNAPLRAGKGHIYEGGIREPMIVRAPGRVQPQTQCAEPVSSIDFFPTILSLAGLRSPAGLALDGVDLTPLLTQTGGLAPRTLFWHYPHYSPQGGRPAAAARRGSLKLVELFEDDRLELYDLQRDPGETTDLAARMPAETQQLHRLLRAWRHDIGARMPLPNPHHDPDAPTAVAKARRQPAPPLPRGDRDKDFDHLVACAVNACDMGYAVRAGETPGVALKKLEQPLNGSVRLAAELQSLQADRSPGAWRNGFVVFGAGTSPDQLVCCGLYLGGRRKLSVIEGGVNGRHRAEMDLAQGPYTRFSVEVEYDSGSGAVIVAANGMKVSLNLNRPPRTVRYTGYAAVNTTTAFTDVRAEPIPNGG